MDYFIEGNKFREYVTLPQKFEVALIDQSIGFSKVFKIIPLDIYQDIQIVNPDVFAKLTKAALYYSFIFSIPRLKVQITNYGVQEFSQDKIKSSPWWDIRDLGLSMLKVADACFSEAISWTEGNNELKSKLNFFSYNGIISTPAEFEEIHSINNSIDVFLSLKKLIKKAEMIDLRKRLNKECIDALKSNAEMKSYLQEALAYYALYYASLVPSFLFTQNALVYQYQELPWQKSVVFSMEDKEKYGRNCKGMADDCVYVILRYIKDNKHLFPCYSDGFVENPPIVKDSGLYL